MYIFSSQYRKHIKHKLVNALYDFYQQHKVDRYSDDLVAFFIKACHMYHPITCTLLICFAPKWLALTTYFSVIGVILLFLYIDGCFLSMLEYKINRMDVNIADVIIMLFKDDITPANRITYSILSFLVYMILTSVILLCRFYVTI